MCGDNNATSLLSGRIEALIVGRLHAGCGRWGSKPRT